LNKTLTIVSILILLVLGIIIITKFDSDHDVKLAKQYIKEYRFAKALSLLNDSKKKNTELQQLLFFAAIKAKNFKTADIILEDIKSFDANFKKSFYEIVKVLYKKDEDDLLAKVLARSSNIKLEQNYLISLSKKQKNIDKEMQVLLMGRKLFLDIKEDLLAKKKMKDAEAVKIDKLEKYILERYMNQANLFIAHQDYKSALEQMKKAETLTILQEKESIIEVDKSDIVHENDSSKKSDEDQIKYVEFKEEKASYKYLLGTINKFLGNKELAWRLIRESADLGSLQAQDSIEQAKRRYRKI
jgi:hypothetical protein